MVWNGQEHGQDLVLWLSFSVPEILVTGDNNRTDQVCCETFLRPIDEQCFTKAKDHFYLLEFAKKNNVSSQELVMCRAKAGKHTLARLFWHSVINPRQDLKGS